MRKCPDFAFGRPLSFSDRREVNNIAIKLRKNGDGLNTLVKLIVTSKIFQSK